MHFILTLPVAGTMSGEEKHVRNHSRLVRPKQNHSSHILQKPARNVGNSIVCMASKQTTYLLLGVDSNPGRVVITVSQFELEQISFFVSFCMCKSDTKNGQSNNNFKSKKKVK